MGYPGEMAWTVSPGLMVFPVHLVQEENQARMAEMVPKGMGGPVVPLGHKVKLVSKELNHFGAIAPFCQFWAPGTQRGGA